MAGEPSSGIAGRDGALPVPHRDLDPLTVQLNRNGTHIHLQSPAPIRLRPHHSGSPHERAVDVDLRGAVHVADIDRQRLFGFGQLHPQTKPPIP